MKLECACIDRPKLEREHDIFLMDAACARSKEELSDANIRIINYCRNYLEVKRLSDICTADGQFILPSFWDGHRSVKQSKSRLEEILQDRPQNKDWVEWRKLLRSFCHPGSTKRLFQSLGQWTTTIHTSQRLWPFYYSSTTEILYRGYREDWHDNMKYQFDECERDDDDVFAFEPEERNVELKYIPNDAVSVDIATARHGWIICQFHTLKPQPTVGPLIL